MNTIDETKIVGSEAESIEETENTEKTPQLGTSPQDYKVMIDLIDEMREQYKTLKTFYEDYVTKTYHMDPKILNAILPITKERIQKMSLEDMEKFLSQYTTISLEDFKERQKILEEISQDGEEKLAEDGIRNVMLDLKQSSMTIYTQKRTLDKTMHESNEVLEEYFNYMSSDTVKESRKQYRDNMQEALEKEVDEDKKKKMERMIKDLDAAESLSFLFTRFEKFGEKEIDRIVSAFFDTHKGQYVIDRFNSKIKKFGFNPSIFSHFLNLEETFLPEEWHPYNNLFLFIYMRTIAHADPYNKTDKMWVHSLTAKISDLIYHRYPTITDEKLFIATIIQVLSNFENNGWRDKFYKDNETWIGHKSRQEADKKHEADRREVLINKLKELEITGYDENATADELQKYFEEQVNILIDSQADDFESELKLDETEDEEEEIIDVEPEGLTKIENVSKPESNTDMILPVLD